MLCCPEVGILCIALERKEVSKMTQYVVDMQTEKQEKFYFIREKESMDIVLLPSKYLMHNITEYDPEKCICIILLSELYG